MTRRTLKVVLTALCLLCIAFDWKLTVSLSGSEFAGGRITGPLYNMSEVAFLLFAISLFLLMRLPRMSAAALGIAALLCIPLSLLLLAPGPFRRIAGGEWSVPLESNFVLNWWTVGWNFALAASIVVSLVILLQPRSGTRIKPAA